jgi:hypothetical protein
MRFLRMAFFFGSFIFSLPVVSHTTYHPDIRAKITSIRRASAEDQRRIIGTIMVEVEEANAKVDKANLIITAKTRILKEQNDKRIEATFEDFKIGQLIEAEFVKGPTIMIYPLQVAAAEIVILNNGE